MGEAVEEISEAAEEETPEVVEEISEAAEVVLLDESFNFSGLSKTACLLHTDSMLDIKFARMNKLRRKVRKRKKRRPNRRGPRPSPGPGYYIGLYSSFGLQKTFSTRQGTFSVIGRNSRGGISRRGHLYHVPKAATTLSPGPGAYDCIIDNKGRRNVIGFKQPKGFQAGGRIIRKRRRKRPRKHQEISEAVEETPEAVEEISEVAEEASETAEEVSEATEEASEGGEEASEATEEASEGGEEASEATVEASEGGEEASEATEE